MDFNSGEGDVICLISTVSIFKELLAQAGSSLTANQFTVGTTATSANAQVIYDQATGYLYYDANGNTSSKDDKKLIAIVDNKASLTANDIQISLVGNAASILDA